MFSDYVEVAYVNIPKHIASRRDEGDLVDAVALSLLTDSQEVRRIPLMQSLQYQGTLEPYRGGIVVVPKRLDAEEVWNRCGHIINDNLPAGTDVVYPGSFNPPHPGHAAIVEVLQEEGLGVALQLETQTPHKGGLTVQEVLRRLRLIGDEIPGVPVVVTRGLGLFADKVQAWPTVDFAMGHDTYERMLDPVWGAPLATMGTGMKDRGQYFHVFERNGRRASDIPGFHGSSFDSITIEHPDVSGGWSSTAIRESKK